MDGPAGRNGVADVVESFPDSAQVPAPIDTDRDRLPDFLDVDSDGDGRSDADEAGDADRATPPRDADGDGLPDYRDPDDDGDGRSTRDERPNGADVDSDGDGTPDFLDPDDDGDGIPSGEERGQGTTPIDTDGDGIPDFLDPDDDGDGVPTETERGDGITPIDTDGDGIPDFRDTDDDGDGTPTLDEPTDADQNGIPDRLEPEARGTLAGGALCAARPGDGGGDATNLVLFGMGTLLLVVRRRRRCSQASRCGAPAAWLGVVFFVGASAGVARAQVALDRFNPAPLASDGFALARPDVPKHLEYGFLLVLDYADDPLAYEIIAGESRGSERIVQDQLVVHAGFSLGLWSRLALFGLVPVEAMMKGETPRAIRAPSADGAGLGDVALGARVRLAGDPSSRMALSGELIARVPTARVNSERAYSGDAVGSYEPALVAELRAGRFDVRTRLGGRLRKKQDVGNLELGQELLAGIGARLRLTEKLFMHAELYGSTFAPRMFKRSESPVEGLLGLKYRGKAWHFGAAAGPGLSYGYGSPDVRVVALVGFAPHEPADSDGDGSPDDKDACPQQPEDRDGFEDEDGCPDPDNDGDGVPDANDACPSEAEDRDGVDDADGCPDPDVAAAQAPEADRDGDGVLDAADGCVDEPEDRDGFEDEDGCPEAGPEARVRCGKLDVAVNFDLNVALVPAASSADLDGVVATLQRATYVLRARVEGHADDRGTDAYNMRLSRQRAQAVKRYLVEHGVEAGRLDTIGYGERRPLSPERTEESRARNRRVELNVTQLRGGCDEAPTPPR